jgi:hypothetical protein
MFGWLLGKKRKTETTHSSDVNSNVVLSNDGSYDFDIVGESHYQPQLERIVGGKTEDGSEFHVDAKLVCEPDNAYDKNAVAVKIKRSVVGYIPKDDIAKVRAMMNAQRGQKSQASVKAVIVGGWLRDDGEGHFGVKLDI